LGATPDDNDADSICTAIQKIYDDQYSVGKDAGVTEGKSNCSHKGWVITVGGYHNTNVSDGGSVTAYYRLTIKNAAGTTIYTTQATVPWNNSWYDGISYTIS
jgi:hypothetical protein